MTGPLQAQAASKPCTLYSDHGSARYCVTEGHHLFPEYLQKRVYGQTVLKNTVWLCSNCHENVHAWLYFLLGERQRPAPEPPIRAKRLAIQAYDWYQEVLAERR